MQLINKIKMVLGLLKPDAILLIIRIVVGIIFMQTGFGKLSHLADTTLFFTDLGIPFPAQNALLASATEFMGGCLLILGLATRFIAIPLTVIMAIAILTTQFAALQSVSEFIRLQELDYMLFFITLFLAGPGKLSIDHLIRRYYINEPEKRGRKKS